MGARVTIDPNLINDDPRDPEWEWTVEIVIGGHLYEGSDENGDFVISRDGLYAFGTADEAFHWAYRWLTSRGYDTAYMELAMKPIVNNEFHRMKART